MKFLTEYLLKTVNTKIRKILMRICLLHSSCIQVESWKLVKYPVMTTEEYLYFQTLGIHFQLEKTHFGNNSRLELRCTAKIVDLPEWHRTVTIYPASSRFTNEKPAPDRYQNNFGK